MTRPMLLLALLLASAAPVLGAQETRRPNLPRGADPNDWEAYFDHGVDRIQRQRSNEAEALFRWASRLAPHRAEPLFGQWVAFWMSDYGRWEQYLDGSERVLRDPHVIAADSLRLRALHRNPLVPTNLEILLYDRLPGRWRRDSATQGWIAYAANDHPLALRLLGRVAGRDDDRGYGARYLRAQTFVAIRQYDSAAVELRQLREVLDQRDARELVVTYQSKELVEYAIGFVEAARSRSDAAREAMGRALAENLGFAPAHEFLGMLAAEAGRHAEAEAEYRAALEKAPADGVLLFRLGIAQRQQGRAAEAAATLRRAVELEPHFAAARLELAAALDVAGDPGAADAYREYVRRAPRSEAARVRRVEARIAALAAPPTP